jgi:propionyl-CoA carboxylase alpha chain
MPTGWRNTHMPPQRASYEVGGELVEVTYRARRDATFELGDGSVARVHATLADQVDVEIDGRRFRAAVAADGDDLYLQVPTTTVHLRVVPRFVVPGPAEVAGGFVAPMPGRVLDVRVEPGRHVTAGETLVVLEAMKMEHHMAAPEDGVVAEVRVAAGDQVENGALLLVFEPHDRPEEAGA